MNNDSDLSILLSNTFGWELPETGEAAEVEKALTLHIRKLIQEDFQKLIALLYRFDVSEALLRDKLRQNSGQDAESIIAKMILIRGMEKIKTRQEFRQRTDENDTEERW